MKKDIQILCIAILPLMVCSGMVYSVITVFFYNLGASKTHIGLIFMCGAATGAVFAPFLGRLSDRLGRFLVLLGSMTGFAIVFLLYALAKNYLNLYLIQILEGISWTAFVTSSTALIADIAPQDERGWAMGLYNRAWNIGWIIGPAFGGFSSDTIGFRFTFLIGAILVAFGIFLTLFLRSSIDKKAV